MKATLFAFLLTAAPVQAMSETLAWRFANESGQALSVELYSQKRQGHVWPGDGQVWTLPGNGVMYTSPISCERREKVCYGAWLPNDEGTYWGVGRNNGKACDDCCYDCTGIQTQVIRLKPLVMPITSPDAQREPADEAANPDFCNPKDVGPKILRSANSEDVHGDWGVGGEIGTSWFIYDVRREGEFLSGCLHSPRAEEPLPACTDRLRVFVFASQWNCENE
jgi:hypothetical protein